MAERPERPRRRVRHTHVLRSERLTPHLVRVVVGGPELSDLGAGEYTDHYIKVVFPPPGGALPEDVDPRAMRELPDHLRPLVRTYTIRSFDPASGEMAVDFVYHGEEGVAGPWAVAARPGDDFHFMGPGGGYAPDPHADWHLLAGDEAALPALAAALERMPSDAVARVFVEVAGPDEELKLEAPTAAEIVWVHRDGAPSGVRLAEAVRSARLPEGEPQAFVHGEAHFVKDMRHLLRVEMALPAERLSLSGYWRRGADEDVWQSTKRDWNQRIEETERAELSA